MRGVARAWDRHAFAQGLGSNNATITSDATFIDDTFALREAND